MAEWISLQNTIMDLETVRAISIVKTEGGLNFLKFYFKGDSIERYMYVTYEESEKLEKVYECLKGILLVKNIEEYL